MKCLSSAQPRGWSLPWPHWLHRCWYKPGLYNPCSRHCPLHQAEPASSLKLFAFKIQQFAHTRSTLPLPFPSAITVWHREPKHSSGFGQSWIHNHIQHFPRLPGVKGRIWLQALLNPSCTPVPPDSPVPPLVPCHRCSSLGAKPSEHSDSCHPPVPTLVPFLQPAASLAVSSGPPGVNNWFQSNAHKCSIAPRASQALPQHPQHTGRRAHHRGGHKEPYPKARNAWIFATEIQLPSMFTFHLTYHTCLLGLCLILSINSF